MKTYTFIAEAPKDSITHATTHAQPYNPACKQTGQSCFLHYSYHGTTQCNLGQQVTSHHPSPRCNMRTRSTSIKAVLCSVDGRTRWFCLSGSRQASRVRDRVQIPGQQLRREVVLLLHSYDASDSYLVVVETETRSTVANCDCDCDCDCIKYRLLLRTCILRLRLQ